MQIKYSSTGIYQRLHLIERKLFNNHGQSEISRFSFVLIVTVIITV